MAQVHQPLRQVRLGVACVPLAERERDLRHAQAAVPAEDLEQDLEPVGPQDAGIDGLPAHQEEAAHRVGAAAQPHRERDLGQRGRALRDEPAVQAREAFPRAARDVAAGDDDVGVRIERPVQELGHDLRRVLQVAVQDDDVVGVGRPQPGRDGAAEAADALPRPAVQDVDLDHGRGRERADGVRRAVVGVVDDQHSRRHPDQRGVEPGDQRSHVVPLVVGGDDDGEAGCAGPRRRRGEPLSDWGAHGFTFLISTRPSPSPKVATSWDSLRAAAAWRRVGSPAIALRSWSVATT